MFFEYKVNHLPPDSEEMLEERGLTFASNYMEATKNLIYNFGEENIVDIYLQSWDNYECVSLEEIKEGFDLT